jgi:hypothetical protein
MRRTYLWVLFLLTLALALHGFAQTGNSAPNGAHYNLNIIGVEDAKTAPMTGLRPAHDFRCAWKQELSRNQQDLSHPG